MCTGFAQVFNRFASEQEAQDGAAHTWSGAGPRRGHPDHLRAAAVSVADIEMTVSPQVFSKAITRLVVGASNAQVGSVDSNQTSHISVPIATGSV